VAKTSDGLPRLRLIQTISTETGPVAVWLMDGNLVRLSDIDFTNFGQAPWYAEVPPDEMWVDDVNGEVPGELNFYLANMVAQRLALHAGQEQEAARKAGLAADLKLRRQVDGLPDQPLKVDELAARVELETLGQDKNGITIKWVNGRLVRGLSGNPDWVEGGHDLVYDFVPHNTIWIDDQTCADEVDPVENHESDERQDMAVGVPYEEAHRKANEKELKARQQTAAHNPAPDRKESIEMILDSRLQILKMQAEAETDPTLKATKTLAYTTELEAVMKADGAGEKEKLKEALDHLRLTFEIVGRVNEATYGSVAADLDKIGEAYTALQKTWATTKADQPGDLVLMQKLRTGGQSALQAWSDQAMSEAQAAANAASEIQMAMGKIEQAEGVNAVLTLKNVALPASKTLTANARQLAGILPDLFDLAVSYAENPAKVQGAEMQKGEGIFSDFVRRFVNVLTRQEVAALNAAESNSDEARGFTALRKIADRLADEEAGQEARRILDEEKELALMALAASPDDLAKIQKFGSQLLEAVHKKALDMIGQIIENMRHLGQGLYDEVVGRLASLLRLGDLEGIGRIAYNLVMVGKAQTGDLTKNAPGTKDRILEFITGQGFTPEQAEVIYQVYSSPKIGAIKTDIHGGGWQFAHGGFAEKATMQRALEQGQKADTPGDLTKAEPTNAQKESGNYKKKHVSFQGLDISVENPKGSTRSGKNGDGTEWATKMHFDYGYIKRTKGLDGDHVDVYVGPDEKAENVFVVHQVMPDSGKYDEDKCMLGFKDADAAKSAYLKQYDSPKYFGAMSTVPVSLFKEKVLSDKGEPIVPDAKKLAEAKKAEVGGIAKMSIDTGEITGKAQDALARVQEIRKRLADLLTSDETAQSRAVNTILSDIMAAVLDLDTIRDALYPARSRLREAGKVMKHEDERVNDILGVVQEHLYAAKAMCEQLKKHAKDSNDSKTEKRADAWFGALDFLVKQVEDIKGPATEKAQGEEKAAGIRLGPNDLTTFDVLAKAAFNPEREGPPPPEDRQDLYGEIEVWIQKYGPSVFPDSKDYYDILRMCQMLSEPDKLVGIFDSLERKGVEEWGTKMYPEIRNFFHRLMEVRDREWREKAAGGEVHKGFSSEEEKVLHTVHDMFRGGVQDIADETGLENSRVAEALNSLKEKGFVTNFAPPGGGQAVMWRTTLSGTSYCQ
jgi:DNA-binding MarR family transcriptional regulator